MGIERFERFFPHKLKLPLHILEAILIHGVIGIATARMFMKPKPQGRGNTIALSMSAKGMMFLSYQVMTSYIKPFKRFASLKAYIILNAIEAVTWMAVIVLGFQQNQKNKCHGTVCYLNYATWGLSGILHQISMYLAVLCYFDWRFFRQHGVPRGEPAAKTGDPEEASTLEHVQMQNMRK